MTPSELRNYSNPRWLQENYFRALKTISQLLSDSDINGREALIRMLEHRATLPESVQPILSGLIQKAGLYPYLLSTDTLNTCDLLNYEFHAVDGLGDREALVLHSMQGKVYRALCDGANVILSAPTSFGKSLLIDVMIASGRYSSVVVVVPTIALIDETRRRLTKTFGTDFKIITHASQERSERNIFVLTQERFVEFGGTISPDFFVIDEFYKLSPERGDDRTFVLNHVFYKLIKTGAQFFLIGPNINDVRVGKIQFRYFQTDFATVATEIRYRGANDPQLEAVRIAKGLNEPTLIFCKSARSAYELAKELILSGVGSASQESRDLADWVRRNYHKDWLVADFLDAGIAVHHGALPRSLAYHTLRLFNSGKILYLLCTSTIIEGVNTSAKHIIIYDNKIATTKFDHFTFNNIKGRAGRMFKHFVGHVYVLQDPPQPVLPFVDVPSLTQPEGTPDSLLVQIDDADLSDRSKEQLRYLYAQDILPVELIRENAGTSPQAQLSVAERISNDLERMHPLLCWRAFPNRNQLRESCLLVFDYLMDGRRVDGARTANQLTFTISRFVRLQKLDLLIEDSMKSDKEGETATDAVEGILRIQRNLIEFLFPRCLMALDKIQRHVFETNRRTAGDYSLFATSLKNQFMPAAATLLEEYGLPFQVTLQVLKKYKLDGEVDEMLATLRRIDPAKLNLTSVELEMLKDSIENS